MLVIGWKGLNMASRSHTKRKNGNNRATHPCGCNQDPPGACEFHDPMPMDELEMRRGMVNSAIKMVLEEGDPYSQIENYRLQAANINAAILKKNDKSKKPPPTKVGLKTGSLAGKAQKADGSMG